MKQILLVTQKNAAQDDPTSADIYSVGTVGTVLQLLRSCPTARSRCWSKAGSARACCRFADHEAFFQALRPGDRRREGPGRPARSSRARCAHRGRPRKFEQYIKLNKKIPPEVLVSINQIEDPSQARRHARLASGAEDPREAGAAGGRDRSPKASSRKVFGYMEARDRRAARSRKHIRSRVKRQMEKTQREYYLKRAAEGDPEGAGRGRGRQR